MMVALVTCLGSGVACLCIYREKVCISNNSPIFILEWSHCTLIQHYFICCSTSSLLGSFQWFPCVFDMPSSAFFLMCLYFLVQTHPCFRLILHMSCPSPGLNHFSKERWFPILEKKRIKSQNPDAVWCMPIVVGSCFFFIFRVRTTYICI